MCAILIAVSVVAVYILGLIFKMIYYKWFHPNVSKEELIGIADEKSSTGLGPTGFKTIPSEEVDSPQVDENALYDIPMLTFRDGEEGTDVTDRSGPSPPALDVKCCNKRMRKLAENFYS